MNAAALAVFVKTPALSPVKTRLAADAGAACARAVYAESLRLLRRRLRDVSDAGVAVHWAVAEEQAATLHDWADYPALWTGDGGLGQRLHAIYSQLRQTHERVVLVGADCPQLPANYILRAAGGIDGGGTVIGPARDGGFYLFASGEDISATQWNAPTYSSEHTLAMLREALGLNDATATAANFTQLPMLTDIDDCESLAQAIDEFAAAANATDGDSNEVDELRRLLALATAAGGRSGGRE